MLTFIKKWWFVLFYLLLFTIAINAVVLNRFWQFEAFYYDHGIYDSSLWQVAHFHWPMIDHLEDGFIRQFGDHFTPTLYLLVPLYWLTSAYEPILIIGCLLVVGSAFVIFLIAKDKIPNRLMVFAIVLAYTLFIGLQNTVIANLHSELPAMLTLALTLLCIEKKRWWLFWLFLILTLGSKQNFAAIGVGLGIYLLTIQQKRLGLATIIFSFVFYLFATKFAIPVLGLRSYAYGSSLYSPVQMFINGFLPPIKLETMVVSFTTFGLLPFACLGFLPTILQDFFTRFVFSSLARWDLGLHYNATLAVLLAYGSIVGVATLSKFKWYRKILIFHAMAIILIVLYFHRVKYHGAFGLAYNPAFYRHTAEMRFLQDFVDQIPPGKRVMTLNNLAPHLTHGDTVMLLGDYKKERADIIALDIRDGQNPSNFWPVQGNYPGSFEGLYSDPDYKLVKYSDTLLMFVRRNL